MLAMPAVMLASSFLISDRLIGTHFYNYAEGGDNLLFQHLFWFFGHPEVYVLILPGFGIISEVLPVFARKPIFGYKAIAASTVMIGFLGLLTWIHHMFTTPLPIVIFIFAMIASFLIAVPTGIKIFNWIGTLWQGSIEFRTPLLFATGMIALFTIGGISGIFLAMFPVDWQLNDTYYVVAHIHFVFVGGSVFAIFAGIYYWFPKVTGRMLSEAVGRWSFALMFLGTLVTFLIQHSLGLDGMPRRVYEYDNVGNLELYNQVSTVGSFILGIGVLLTVINVARSLTRGAVAGPDPWQANTLEWFVPSPPPEHNFDEIPRVRSLEPMKDIRREVERGRRAPAPAAAGAPTPAETRISV
jgi:cytochrome c oxidase subunit 1